MLVDVVRKMDAAASAGDERRDCTFVDALVSVGCESLVCVLHSSLHLHLR